MNHRRNNMRLDCPHCGAFARIRSSQTPSPLYREAVVECQSLECGWRGKIGLEFICTLTPSQKPSPEIRLPVSEVVRKNILGQLTLELPEAANARRTP
ncbi:MAG: ogr/Delta-like zinc finger family protein [Ectothiorhodospiraceae bacterium]|nr:ogr/Delta-like zinc finger family protein [Ectothiorhodospiraceae bacterium]